MTTYAFLLDLGRCIGCQACVAACKTGNALDEGTQYIHISDITRGTFPELQNTVNNHRCYHCLDAACVSVCPTGALFKENGLTRLDHSRCSGCSYCVDACPFDVPRIVDGHSSKCDGCADVVQAGGQPWCVKTCPSQALMYGERQEVLAEARVRLEAMQVRYPKARIYGETEAGGLGVIMVLPDDPQELDLPANPQIPTTLNVWQNVVQPMSLGLTGLSVMVMGAAAVIARRNHKLELVEIHKNLSQTDPASKPAAEEEKES